MLNAPNNHSTGFTLIELMVGMTVGLFVVLAMSAVYINALRGSGDATNANRLNQDLRAVMDIIVADVRRAGYWGAAAAGGVNPFSLRTGNATDIYISAGCILYSYDATYLGGTTGVADTGLDFFGFRLNSNAVQMVTGNSLNNTASSCGNVTWTGLTDPAAVQITALTFTTVGSQGIVFDPANFNPSTLATPAFPGSSTFGAWWSVTSGSTPACESAPPSGVTIPASGPNIPIIRVELRQINITLTGRSAQDSTFQRTLTESVFVRNNRITTEPAI
jgi:type IV pilus assembly protein PilW